MWHGRTVYFLSDRGPNQRYNIWVHNLDSKETRQVTRLEDFDIHFPAIGPSDMVFEAGGRLYLLDLENEEMRPVDIEVVTDQSTLKPRMVNAANLIQNARISPKGKRALFEARGEIFSVPAEHGPIRNLTRSAGAAERNPAWSPMESTWPTGATALESTSSPSATRRTDPKLATHFLRPQVPISDSLVAGQQEAGLCRQEHGHFRPRSRREPDGPSG